jgi:hypothetical protein
VKCVIYFDSENIMKKIPSMPKKILLRSKIDQNNINEILPRYCVKIMSIKEGGRVGVDHLFSIHIQKHVNKSSIPQL